MGHASKHKMAPAKGTRAHELIKENAKLRISISGHPGGSPQNEFKMRRFKDVKGRISTNIQTKPRHCFLEQVDTDANAAIAQAKAYGSIVKPSATPEIPTEEKKEN